MTAICKTIPVHGTHLNSLLDYGADQEKTSIANEAALNNLFEYAKNEIKTTFVNPLDNEKSLLVTGVKCIPEKADGDFKDVRNKYNHSNVGISKMQEPLSAIHLIQSFKETNISPIVAHKIGIEMLERLGYMGVVDTHMNKTHVHNHIIINSYIPDTNKKINLCKSFIFSIRQLSDDIQKEYGIPLEFAAPPKQLEQSRDSLAYGEWAAQLNKTSWKADMFEAMLVASSSTSSREEYIQLMNRFGYEVSSVKSNGDIVWLNLNKTKKIKESTLYKEFTGSNQRRLNTSYTRFDYLEKGYSWDGRQLTNIENLLRETYNTVSLVGNFLSQSKHTLEMKAYNLEFKQAELKWAHNLKELHAIESMTDINQKLNDVGAQLSIVKKQVSDIESIRDYYSLLEDYSSAALYYKTALLDARIDISKLEKLFLPSLTRVEIAKNNATASPISNIQKKELYFLMMKHPDYRIKNNISGFLNVSTIDYYNICNFFKNGGDLPNCLCTKNDLSHDFAYESQYDFFRKKFNYSATKKQLNSCIKLLKANNYDVSKINIDNITLADVINIENCLGPTPDLSKCNESFPSPASPHDVERCIDICKMKGLIPPINPKDMSSEQFRRFYSWACSQGRDPKCMESTTSNEEYENMFYNEYQNLPMDTFDLLLRYRAAALDLNKLGLTVTQAEMYLEQFEKLESSLISLRNKQHDFSGQYKDLIHLKQIISFSYDTNYVYGSEKLRKEFSEKLSKSYDYNNTIIQNQKEYELNKKKEIDFEL